jgi:hypothetical protein
VIRVSASNTWQDGSARILHAITTSRLKPELKPRLHLPEGAGFGLS